MRISATVLDDRLVVTVEGIPDAEDARQQLASAAATAVADWMAYERMPVEQRREWARAFGHQLLDLAVAPDPGIAEVIPLDRFADYAIHRRWTQPAIPEEPLAVDVAAEPPSPAAAGDVVGQALTEPCPAGETSGGGRATGDQVPAAAAPLEQAHPTEPETAPEQPADPDDKARAAALELLVAGVGPAVIARELDVPLANVRAWKKEIS